MTVQRRQSVPVLNEVRPNSRDGSSLMRAVLNLNQHCAALTRYLFELESRVQVAESSIANLKDYPWVIAMARYITVPATNSVNLVGPTKNVSGVTSTTSRVRFTYSNAFPNTNYHCFSNAFVTTSADFATNPVTITTSYAEVITHDMASGAAVNPQTTTIAGQIWCIDPAVFAGA